uniref:Uncharacterized protein n=1 Tax=Cyprinus carpio TaxID=7962 RepID=A0A8C1KCB1_CYPCA
MHSYPGAQLVDKHRSELIQKVCMVMPVVEELLSQGLLNEKTRLQISTANTDEEKMIELYKALDAGGDEVKSAFYSELKDYEPHLIQDLDDLMFQYNTSNIDRSKFVTECILPSDECVELVARYTEPVIIQRSKEQTEKYYHDHAWSVDASSQLLSKDKNQSIRIDQLFSPDCDGNTPKTVILSGDSGRGKSFILQKIMLDWASGELYFENFDVVFLLKCEELECISEEMNLNELLNWSSSLTSNEISQILELTPEKVLILIDGMDEYVFYSTTHFTHTNPSKKAHPMVILRNLLRGVFLPESSVLVTKRSIEADVVVNLIKGPLRFTEIMGFSEKGVQEYFQKFFQDEEFFRDTYESVKTNESLLTACSVPLLCWMVCFCLKKHFTDDGHVMRELKTTTSIYVHFVSTLLEHHGHSQSVLTMLRSLGQLAEEGMKKKEYLFLENRVTETGLDPAATLFLYKKHLKRELPVFRFMHLSFQEFFTALYYVLMDEEKSWEKISALLNSLNCKDMIDRPSPERRSNLIPSVMMFLCGLLNEKVSSSLFEKIKWTVPQIKKLKTNLQESVLTVRRQDGCELLFAIHCLYELQDQKYVTKALKTHNFIDLSNISLRSTDCWVLLYCLQCCLQVRDLNLMYCDLTAEKLKILQPALCMCKTMRLSVEHLSEAGDLIRSLGESKILRELNIQEDEYSAESPRWSLNLSVTNEDVLLSLNSSERNVSFPAVLNISLTCPQSEIFSTDWSRFLQKLSKTGRLADNSSALDEHVSLLLSSFHSVGLKMLDLELVSLNKSWASGIISLIQTCTSLQQLSVSVTGLLLEEGHTLLKKSLTDPHCTVIIEGRKCSKPTDQCKEQDWSHSCNEKVKIHFKPKELEEVCSKSTYQCTENTWSHCCNEKVEGLFTPEELEELEELEKLNISDSEPSGLNLQPLPVCQSCVHIVDSDQWVQVEPSLCTDGGSEFRISTPAGRFECSRTRMRWVCAGDVTLQYCAMDGCFLSEELERLQCERIGPVIDVTVIAGKLEEAQLPHYACLAESDPSLTDAVKLLSVEEEGIHLESVELTRFHARIIQPSFCPTTVVTEKDIPVEQHLDLLICMIGTNPLILHVYLFPMFDTFSKKKIMEDEKAKDPNIFEIGHPRPEKKFQMETPYILNVSDADVLPEEGISFSSKMNPNFFMIRQGGDTDRDVQMTLIRQHDQNSVWKTIIFKEILIQKQKIRKALKRKQDNVCLFDEHWLELINRVTDPLTVADKLLSQKVISEEEYSKIRFKFLSPQERMREICYIVRNGGNMKKANLMLIIQQTDPLLFRDLEQKLSP